VFKTDFKRGRFAETTKTPHRKKLKDSAKLFVHCVSLYGTFADQSGTRVATMTFLGEREAYLPADMC